MIASIEKLADGSDRHASSIRMLHNTGPVIRADRDAAVTARTEHNEAKIALSQLRELLEETRLEARNLGMLTRDVLKPVFGTAHSPDWIVTGYAKSLETPVKVDELIHLTETLDLFFTTNPAYELPSLQLTAARARLLNTTLTETRSAINSQLLRVAQLKEQRDAAFRQLRKRMGWVIEELNQLISPTDPRWFAFGLNMPGAIAIPEPPEEVEVVVVNETTAMLTFPPSPGTDYYRVYKRVVGVDAEPVPIGSAADPDFTFEELPRQSTIEFYIRAANASGMSAFSAVSIVRT